MLTIMNKSLNHLLDLPTPKKISWWWLGGSLLGFILVIQIVSGYVISCFYTKDFNKAYVSMDSLNRDMKFGSMIRHIHVFGASSFFFLIYLHMGRGLYYNSFLKKINVWMSGVAMYLLLMMTSFVGYVLPWAQMSFWAATVITKFITVIPLFGMDIVQWVWGSFSVDYTTLMRFYTLHFLLPSILALLSLLHIILLHNTGSSSPLGMMNNYQRFSSFCLVKDFLGMFLIFVFLLILYFMNFMVVSDSEQYMEANPFVTPVHMVPEWYFLPAYAILRSVPKKLGGVLLLMFYMLMLFLLPFMHFGTFQLQYNKMLNNMMFWLFMFNFLLLIYLGGSVAEQPFMLFSQISTFLYFNFFFYMSVFAK